MRRKAALGPMTMVWIYLLIMIIGAVGIATGVSIFYGSEYDFRETDASLLSYSVTNCIEEQDLNWDLNQEDFAQEFFWKCNLNQKTIEENNFYIRLTLNNEKTFKFGQGDRTKCALSEKSIPADFRCTPQKSIEKNNVIITIETGSNQKSEEVLA